MGRNTVEIIAAVADNRVVGRDGTMPWHLPEDLKHFRRVTDGKAIIMGRRTWDSLPTRPLTRRLNIVVSSTLARTQADGSDLLFVGSLPEAVAAAHDRRLDAMVIGGTRLWEEALKTADVLYITRVNISPEGDTFFPRYDPADWVLASSRDHQEEGISMEFQTLTRACEPSLSRNSS